MFIINKNQHPIYENEGPERISYTALLGVYFASSFSFYSVQKYFKNQVLRFWFYVQYICIFFFLLNKMIVYNILYNFFYRFSF